MKNIALILLGGVGKRFGGDTPKQFLCKNDIPIYIDAIRKYEDVEAISDILLVVNNDYIDKVKDDLKIFNIKKVIDVIPGGKERFISSYLGIKYLANYFSKDDNVLIADAVRPNTSRAIILANIFGLMESNAVLTAIRGNPQKERVDTAHIVNGIPFLAQTPQSFKLGYIFELYNTFINEENFFPTDDINLVELKKDKFVIVEGEESNYKITNKTDFDIYMGKV
ncbi:MAG: 2-C-methyl-D-erythritol 4-phosphate cytidylyltransferase [Bacilli bacterium]|nr:2-C-methyl-D-erythritol 4-phosphate cytidylyltransferase [Bacilli bacterium]